MEHSYPTYFKLASKVNYEREGVTHGRHGANSHRQHIKTGLPHEHISILFVNVGLLKGHLHPFVSLAQQATLTDLMVKCTEIRASSPPIPLVSSKRRAIYTAFSIPAFPLRNSTQGDADRDNNDSQGVPNVLLQFRRIKYGLVPRFTQSGDVTCETL